MLHISQNEKKLKDTFGHLPSTRPPVQPNKAMATFQKGLSFHHISKLQFTLPNPKLGTPCHIGRLAMDHKARL